MSRHVDLRATAAERAAAAWRTYNEAMTLRAMQAIALKTERLLSIIAAARGSQ